jgi:hypothetical protein
MIVLGEPSKARESCDPTSSMIVLGEPSKARESCILQRVRPSSAVWSLGAG